MQSHAFFKKKHSNSFCGIITTTSKVGEKKIQNWKLEKKKKGGLTSAYPFCAYKNMRPRCLVDLVEIDLDSLDIDKYFWKNF